MPQNISFLQIDPSESGSPNEISVDAQTGTASISVGIKSSPCRNGFQPSLALSYISGSGSSVYGMGWSLQGVPFIGLSLKDGYPKYDGSDKYSFGGQELIPWQEKVGGEWQIRTDDNDNYSILYFRTQKDGLFSRFEKWIDKSTRDVHWRLHSSKNQVMVFGKNHDNSSKILHPQNSHKIFQWLLEAQYDNMGNAIEYEYISEDITNVDNRTTFERNRIYRGEGNACKYLKRIRYGNTIPVLPDTSSIPVQNWLFEVVFDYGEHETEGDRPLYSIGSGGMPVRQDPFSSYIAGFEQRTYRLCRQIMMFHNMEELGEGPTLTGSTRLIHDPHPAGTSLKKIMYTAFKRLNTNRYDSKTLPPLLFEYSLPRVENSFHQAPEQSKDNTPVGLNGLNYKWVDLYGEGLPGVLYESDDSWYYKPNLGNGKLGTQQIVAEKPGATFGSYALSDFDNDGNLNIVVLKGREAGYYEYNRDKEEWDGFSPFQASAHVRQTDNNTQLIDLTGDGRADILTVEDDRITWYPSKGKEGFGKPRQISKPVSNGVSQVPTIGSNAMLDYFFADMNGSGLPDQVLIRNGRVEYWPNLGNGRFGSGIVMEDSPQLDFDFELDASRIKLVDLDGSGTSDLLYIGRGEIKYWINASGNKFIEGNTIKGLPFIDNVSSAQIIDFLGDGTACLVWSSSLPVHSEAPIHYLRLTNGVKPRLLTGVQNSMGLETKFHYGYSGQHYLRDRASAISWVTKLPSHRAVVDKLETIDHIGNTSFSRIYEYRDGFFDGEERTFRGFCQVDQYDSDIYRGTAETPGTGFTDPVCVRTWYHNGAFAGHKLRENYYYAEDQYSRQLKDFEIENTQELQADEFFCAIRSLAGHIIHKETYGLTPEGNRKPHPFQIEHTAYFIRRTQPGNKDSDPGFAVFRRESLDIIYEENPSDPRLTHSFNLEVDVNGITRKQTEIAYPRLNPDALEEQRVFHINAASAEVTGFDERDRYEIGIELESKSFELHNRTTPAVGDLYRFNEVRGLLEATISSPVKFDEEFNSDRQARLIKWNRNYFWNDDHSGVLPWSEAGAKVLLHHQEAACFYNGFLEGVLGYLPDPEFISNGYYVFHDNFWWQPGAIIAYGSAGHFYLPLTEIQPNGSYVEYQYDDYNLELKQTMAVLTDDAGTLPARNQISAEIDYHVLAPYLIEDPNGNITEVVYDPLGIIILSSMHGEIMSESGVLQPYGHSGLSDYIPPLEIDFDHLLANPNAYLQQCATYFYYELDSWDSGIPLRSIALAREEWVHDGEGNYLPESNYRLIVEYKDGFSRTIQSKTLVEAGPDTIMYDSGHVALDAEGEPRLYTTDQPRWLVSGNVVYSNKQEPVRQFEPYFSPIADFENDEILETFGESGLTEYDALGRQKRMIMADGTIARSEVTAWQTRQYDANDSVVGSLYELRTEAAYPSDSPERMALEKAKVHNNTPLISHLDALGRHFLTEETDETGLIRSSRTKLDALGNPGSIIDSRSLPAFTYKRDMQGRIFHEQSRDAGLKWQFINALDQPTHIWNGAGVHHQITYDTWGRVTKNYVDGALGMNHLTEHYIYGEDTSVVNAAQKNLFGQIVEHYDQAGVTRIHRYDLAGNVLEKERRLVEDYMNIPNWSDPSLLTWMEDDPFETKVIYDALGRPKEQHLPDDTIRKYTYMKSGALLQFLLTTADGDIVDQSISEGHIYNARGQVKEMMLGNNVVQHYDYDQYNYRLKRKHAFRRTATAFPSKDYQDVRYTYDAVGNITQLTDNARPDTNLLFNLPRINRYTYDAFYQLILAEGRTHQALQRIDYAHAPDAPGFIKGTRHITADNMDLLQSYTRTYNYDLNGNMQSMVHSSGTRPSDIFRWRRDFWISETSNRSLERFDLSGVEISNPETRFDDNGNLSYLSHLRNVHWNYLNQLSGAVTIERPGGDNDAEYYIYGGDGQRIRKIAQRLNSGTLETTEKIYLDGCEIKRIRQGSTVLLERFTSHLSDGNQRIAYMHRWTIDTKGRETNNVAEKRIHYQLSCHLGSSAFELDKDGEIINYEEYFAFGGTAFIYGDSLRDVEMKDYRYSGKERDDATGLYYYGFRYYAPWMGRWLNPDPVGPEDGLNLYRFVHNNPVNNSDPYGLQSSGHFIGVNDETPTGHAERSYTLTEEGQVYTGIYLNPADAREVQSPGEYYFSSGEENIEIMVTTTVRDGHPHFHISESYIFGATAVVDAPTRIRRAEPDFNLEDFVVPLSDEEFDRMITELTSEMTDHEFNDMIRGLAGLNEEEREVLDSFLIHPDEERHSGSASINNSHPSDLPLTFDRPNFDELPEIPNVCNQTCHDPYEYEPLDPVEVPGWMAGTGVVILGVILIVGGIALAAPTGGASTFAAIEGTMMLAGGVAMVGAGGAVTILSGTGNMTDEKTYEALEGINRAAGLSNPIVLPLTAGGYVAEGFGAPEGTGENAEQLGHLINLGRGVNDLARGALRMRGYEGYGDAFRSWSQSPSTRRLLEADRIIPYSPEIVFRWTDARASDPQAAQTLKYLIEWELENSGGIVTRGTRPASDSALRRQARTELRAEGITLDSKTHAGHILDSAIDSGLLVAEPGRRQVYIFIPGRVNSSFGGTLGLQFGRQGIEIGDTFRIRFEGFPDYSEVKPSFTNFDMWWEH